MSYSTPLILSFERSWHHPTFRAYCLTSGRIFAPKAPCLVSQKDVTREKEARRTSEEGRDASKALANATRSYNMVAVGRLGELDSLTELSQMVFRGISSRCSLIPQEY